MRHPPAPKPHNPIRVRRARRSIENAAQRAKQGKRRVEGRRGIGEQAIFNGTLAEANAHCAAIEQRGHRIIRVILIFVRVLLVAGCGGRQRFAIEIPRRFHNGRGPLIKAKPLIRSAR